jgi:ABC-type cobalamin/Fe3+-siderophores transport system ATPase subunit
LGETDTDPVEDRVDHTLAAQAAATDPIYLPSSRSDSEYRRVVYMVEQGRELHEKTTEELQREAEEEIARAE